MGFTYNGTAPTSVTYNGADVNKITYNGTTVWEAYQLWTGTFDSMASSATTPKFKQYGMIKVTLSSSGTTGFYMEYLRQSDSRNEDISLITNSSNQIRIGDGIHDGMGDSLQNYGLWKWTPTASYAYKVSNNTWYARTDGRRIGPNPSFTFRKEWTDNYTKLAITVKTADTPIDSI